jgi:hypothetical protein
MYVRKSFNKKIIYLSVNTQRKNEFNFLINVIIYKKNTNKQKKLIFIYNSMFIDCLIPMFVMKKSPRRITFLVWIIFI